MNHRKKSKRWPRVLVASVISFAAIGFASQGNAVSANPTPVCSNGLCTVTFDYTGDYYVYAPPSGIRTMSFELTGAQGGRSGGLGGKVTGTLSSIPANLYVYVGGAGKQGASIAGGFNGGGVAGSGHGDEGSGGGASDLRLSTLIDDRIAVAGGGGGTGGWIGLAGAPGGGLIAATGSGTNPSGGAGGTQVAGGSGGLGYSAGSGTAGSKGVGGTGGTGSIGGGGGGGGGYYGGGGGGGDGVPTGSDGAGGGGGSSYASSSYTKSVTHTTGTRAGNGQVVLTYAYSPTVTTFAPLSTAGNQLSVQYSLGFSQTVGGLEAADFGFAGTAGGCAVTGLTGSGTSYVATVTGCSDGTVILALAADSVTGATTGPAAVASSGSVTLDRKNPSFTITPPVTPSNLPSLPFAVTADEPVTGIAAGSFNVAGNGCAVGSVTGSSASYTVNVTGCSTGAAATLTLKAGSASDLGGNTGPLAAVTSTPVAVDLDAPSVLTFTKNPNSRGGMIGFDLLLSEPVTGLSSSSLVIHGDACTLSKFSGSRESYSVWLNDCAQGSSVWLTLKALAGADAAGNSGPLLSADSGSTTIDDVAPTATVTLIDRLAQTAQPSWDVKFGEPVAGFTADAFSYQGTSTGCRFALGTVLAGVTYRVSATNCSPGSIQLLLEPLTVQDATGNLGPLAQVASSAVIIDKTTSQGAGAARFKHGMASSAASKSSPDPTVTPMAVARGHLVQKPKQHLIVPARKLAAIATPSDDKTAGYIALIGGLVVFLVWWFRRSRTRRLL